MNAPEGPDTLTELTIGEVAAVVGIQPHTLRAWERRYGVVRPRRSGSNQRRYTLEDVGRIQEVKEAVGGRPRTVRLAAEQVSADRPQDGASGAAQLPAAVPGGSVWRAAVDLVHRMVFLLDGGGRILDANSTVEHQVGSTREQLAGRPFTHLVNPAERARLAELHSLPLRQHRGWKVRLRGDPASRVRSLESWPVRAGAEQDLLVLVVHDEPASRPTATTTKTAPRATGRL
ncbi:MAG: MerR family transcriptional regulator, partial [Candidatus Dormibacteraeota bacterium]|nr:MerR family transcriptional regulator [Candidatus Dormibacteraeota bacterium]